MALSGWLFALLSRVFTPSSRERSALERMDFHSLTRVTFRSAFIREFCPPLLFFSLFLRVALLILYSRIRIPHLVPDMTDRLSFIHVTQKSHSTTGKVSRKVACNAKCTVQVSISVLYSRSALCLLFAGFHIFPIALYSRVSVVFFGSRSLWIL